MEAAVVGIYVGRVGRLVGGRKSVPSAIFKAPVAGPVWLGREGFSGDEQADRKNHGGREKAAFVYPAEHYARWKEMLGREIGPAAFGENLSTRGLTEGDVCIGDVYRLGGAVVQVSQPRRPCYKPAWRHGVKELALLTQKSGMTGFYLRVLEEAEVAPGDCLMLLEREAPWATISEANRLVHRDRHDEEGIRRLLAVSALSASWRASLKRRLLGIASDDTPRLEGPRGA